LAKDQGACCVLKAKFALMLAGAATFGALALGTVAAQATPFLFDVTGGCSEACAATASITVAAGKLTVVLTDTEANPRSAGDLLSSIEITPSGTVGSPTLSSQAGTLITVASNTGPYSTSPGPPSHWGVGVSTSHCETGASCIALETAGPFAVGGAPTNMIIGPPDASGNYSNGNASVVDGHFSPYINGTGTFVIFDSSITATTTIAGVTFDFGTGPDTFLSGVAVVPAPVIGHGLFVLLAIGGVLFGGELLERSRKRRSLGT
jgi:hypothetical protein